MIMNRMTVFTLLSLFLFILISSFIQVPQPTGKDIFEKKCVKCHGHDGTRGFLGAHNLRASVLSDDELINMITNGKRIMPSWRKRLTPEQIQLVAQYVKTLRKS
jgi:cytochrome c6